jgi:DNA-binding NarL/FixJ family response regulator
MLSALAALAAAHRCEPAAGAVSLATHALDDGSLLATDLGGLHWTAATLVLALADRDEALGELDRALGEAHRRGSVFAVTSARLWRGHALLRRGDLEEAQRELDTAAGEARAWGFDPESRSYGRAFLGLTLLERGERAAAARLLADDAGPQLAADGERLWFNSRIELLVAEGRDEAALRVADTVRERYGRVLLPASAHWRSAAARAVDRLGRTDEALALAAEEVELARRWGAPGALGHALRALGTLERDAGIDRLHEAVAVLEGSPARLELAKAHAALGAALRRARRPSDARGPLRRALELATVCGAPPLVEWARSELYAAGSRPRTTALRGVESLTSSERRVASLAAAGQTNRDIAQTLFVTPKTVEVHLTSAYRKLGIRSRRELAEALAQG